MTSNVFSILIRRSLLAGALLFISFAGDAQAQSSQPLEQPPAEYSASMKESWLEWRVYSLLRDTLLPGYISPHGEIQVQAWLEQLTDNQEQFRQANEHVVNMDRATLGATAPRR